MAVLSNNGRLISSLPATSIISATDEFLIQSNGITKRTSYAALTSSILTSTGFNPFVNQVNFRNFSNKFTGSFYNPDLKSSNFYTVRVRDNITVDGKITGDLTGSVYDTNFSKFTKVYVQQELTASESNLLQVKIDGGSITGTTIGLTSPSTITGTTVTATTGFSGNITSTGTSTFSSIDVNGGSIDGTIIGASSAAAVTGTTITANTGFVGNLTGDVYNSTTTKVLESGNTTPTINGGVSSAFFYGTSSYAVRATLADSALSSVATNGLPIGGTQYQVLAKNSATNYDAGWVTPISKTGSPSQYDMTMWDGTYVIKTAPGFTYSVGSDLYVYSKAINANSGLTGSIYGVITSPPSTVTIVAASTYTINGDLYPSVVLDVQATGATVTLNLRKGKTCTVLVKNNGAYSISTWNTSTDGGATTTSLYWRNGLVPTITSGAGKLDVFTFVNINDYVLGSTIQNFS